MKQQKIIVSVTNDLTTDQRVAKICNTLTELNFEVVLVGRKLPNSLPLNRSYKTKRFNLWFNKGPLFYANYNLRLFFFLLFSKADVFWSNDLDTLLANHTASKWKKKKLIFDSHEYFTEVPELVNRPSVQRIWKRMEQRILPQLKHVLTVSQSIADLYQKEYGINVKLLRNVPEQNDSIFKVETLSFEAFAHTKRAQDDKTKVIIYQGAINVNRGIEFMVKAMNHLDDCMLYLVGKGDISNEISQLIKSENLTEKVKMLGEVPFEKLHSYTIQADLGLSLEEDKGLNYRFALPNKVFNYIHANVPVLVSNLPEMANLVNQYQVGETISTHEPQQIAKKIEQILSNETQLTTYKNNCKKAALNLNWEKEKQVISTLF